MIRDINIIIASITSKFFCTDWETLSQKELEHIGNVLDYPNIEDRFLCDHEEIHPYIKWDRLEKMQAIRVATRHPNLIDKINLSKYEYKIKEIWYFIQADYTRLFKYFTFDLKKLPKEDAYFLLCIGQDIFFDIIKIENYEFNHIECFNILKAYDFKRKVICSLNTSLFNSQQISHIFKATNEEYLDIFSVKQLNTIDWLDLLCYQPGFIKHCDLEKFVDGDPFNLIQLITLFKNPDLSYLLDEIDKDEITALGWEKLLIYNSEKFSKICNFSKIKENNWVEILKYRPELEAHKN